VGRGGEAGFDQGVFTSARADDEDASGKGHGKEREENWRFKDERLAPAGASLTE
jgi:hypothetical protein